VIDYVRYFIQRHGRIEGPLTVDEINSRIASGVVDSHWLGTSDLGESLEQIRKTPNDDWFPLGEIPGIVGVEKPTSAARQTTSDFMPTPRTIILVTSCLWLALGLFGAVVMKEPKVALLPLYAFYPGPWLSGESGYNVAAMHRWAAVTALIFAIIAGVGFIRNNRMAAVVLAALMIISTATVVLRFLGTSRHW
jgi:hypothetical protein